MTATTGIVRAGLCPSAEPGPLTPDRVETFQAELLRRLSFKLAVRIQQSTLPSCEHTEAALADRTVDLVAAVPGYKTAGRAGILETEPYLVVQYALVVVIGSRVASDGLAALDVGARLGVLGETGVAAWASNQFGGRGVAVARFAGERAAVAALARGDIDALILPRTSAMQATKETPRLRVSRLLDTGERASFLVAAGNPGFQRRVDRMLEEIVFDGSYAVIFHRHFAPTPVPVDFLPPD